jgi:Cu2+-exporting ATPase
MTCCTMDAESVLALSTTSSSAEEVRLASQPLGGGLRQLDLSVPDIHCGGCISTIEGALLTLPFVKTARVNLTARRVTCVYQEEMETHAADPSEILAAINSAGYRAHLFTPSAA